MRLRVNIAISFLALIGIIWGVTFAVAQERRRSGIFLQSKYQQLNRAFFENSLPGVQIEWTDLSSEGDAGETYRGVDGFHILIDRKTNVDDEVLEGTIRHELCHAAVWDLEPDPHGPIFQTCAAHVKARL